MALDARHNMYLELDQKRRLETETALKEVEKLSREVKGVLNKREIKEVGK